MVYIGIDPGKTGGVSILVGNSVKCLEMPITITKEIDVNLLLSLFNSFSPSQLFCVIEDLIAMPGQSSKATQTTGINYGKLLAVLEIAGVSYQRVHPAKWKKEFQLYGKSKYGSAEVAKRLFPSEDFVTERGRLMDGAAESLLLAEYARRIYKEK